MQKARKQSAQVAVLKAVRILLGFAITVIAARIFGTGLDRDAWLIALGAINILAAVFFLPLNELLRTEFSESFTKKTQESALISIFWSSSILLLFVSILISVLSEPILRIFAPGLDSNQLEQVHALFVYLIPFLLLNQLNQIQVSFLNVGGVYLISEWTGIAGALAMVISMVFLNDTLGVKSLLVGTYFQVLLVVLVSYFSFKQLGMRLFRFRDFRLKPMLSLISISAPLYLPVAFAQISSAIEKTISTLIGPGLVSAVDYSRKLAEVPLNLVFAIVPAVLVPVLAQIQITRSPKKFAFEFARQLKLYLVIGACFVFWFLSSADQMIALLLGGTLTTIQQQEWTASLLKMFSVFILPVIVCYTGLQALIARRNSRIYTKISLLMYLFTILFSWGFYKSLGPLVFPLGWGLSHFFAAFFVIPKIMRFSEIVQFQLLKMSALCVAVVLIGFLTNLLIRTLEIQNRILMISFLGVLGCFIVAVLLNLFGLKEWKELRRLSQFRFKALSLK